MFSLVVICRIKNELRAVHMEWQSRVIAPSLKGHQRVSSHFKGVSLLSLLGKLYNRTPGCRLWELVEHHPKKSSVVFIPAVVHWTSTLPLVECSRGHGVREEGLLLQGVQVLFCWRSDVVRALRFSDLGILSLWCMLWIYKLLWPEKRAVDKNQHLSPKLNHNSRSEKWVCPIGHEHYWRWVFSTGWQGSAVEMTKTPPGNLPLEEVNSSTNYTMTSTFPCSNTHW